MQEPPILLPSLGLIWIALQLLRRKLPTKHDKFITFLTYLMSWVILSDFFLKDIPAPFNVYTSWITSGLFVVFLVWVYLGKSISKKASIPHLFESKNMTLTLACINEGASIVNLYYTGYLAGTYDTLSPLAEILHTPVTNVLPTVYFGIVFGPASIAISTFLIAYVMYSCGLEGTKINLPRVSSKLIQP